MRAQQIAELLVGVEGAHHYLLWLRAETRQLIEEHRFKAGLKALTHELLLKLEMDGGAVHAVLDPVVFFPSTPRHHTLEPIGVAA